MAAAILPIVMSTLPHVPRIVRAVEQLFGRNEGGRKQQAAVELARIATGIADRQQLSDAVEIAFRVLDGAGVINRHRINADLSQPVPIPVVARQHPGGAIEIHIPEPADERL